MRCLSGSPGLLGGSSHVSPVLVALERYLNWDAGVQVIPRNGVQISCLSWGNMRDS